MIRLASGLVIALFLAIGIGQGQEISSHPKASVKVLSHGTSPERDSNLQEPPPELQPLDLVRPTLPDDVATTVAELSARIAKLEKLGLTAETREAQDTALDEAIKLAEQVLSIRTENQGNTKDVVRWRDVDGHPVEWFEVVDARYVQEYFRSVRGMGEIDRRELAMVRTSATNVQNLSDSGRIDAATSLVELQVDVCRRLFPDHPYLARSLNILGGLRQSNGQLAEAESFLKDSLAMRQRLLPADHPDVARSLNNLAGLRDSNGQLVQAESMLTDSLIIRRRIYPGDHPDIATSLSNLAAIRQSLGRVREAVPLHEESLAMRRRLYPADHFDVATSLNNLASIRHSLGQLLEANQLYEDSLAMLKRLIRGDHPGVATGMSNVARVRKSLGRSYTAEPLFFESLAMRKRLFPDDHPDIASSLHDLAGLRQSQGLLAEAELLFEEGLAMYKRMFRADHPDIASSLYALAQLRVALGRPAEAETLCKESLAMQRRLFPGDHPDIATSLTGVASLYLTLGRAREAEPLNGEALAMYQRLFPMDHPDVASGLNHFAWTQQYLGRPEEAERLHEEALAMLHRLHLGDDPDVASCLMSLAYVRFALDDLAGAERHYANALEMYKRFYSGDHPQVVLSMNHLAWVQYKLGRTHDASTLFQESLSMVERLRTDVRGSAPERALLAGKLNLDGTAAACTRVHIELGRHTEALTTLERGRSRAGLDLFAGGRSQAEAVLQHSADPTQLDRYAKALIEEKETKAAVFEAEAEIAARPNGEKAELLDRIKQARAALSGKTATVFNELRGLVPQVDPLDGAKILAALGDAEALITWTWTDDGVTVIVARDGQVQGFILAANKNEAAGIAETIGSLRQWIASRPNGAPIDNPTLVTTARGAMIPSNVRELLARSKTLIVVADGPLQGIPVELLIEDVPIAYAPSATIAINRLNAAKSRTERRSGAVVLGDPVFAAGTDEKENEKYPEAGVLLVAVVEGGNAGNSGLARGDVILQYGDTEMKTHEDLPPAIAAFAKNVEFKDKKIPVRVWRKGEGLEVSVLPGKMGVQVFGDKPEAGLRSMAVLDRSGDLLSAEVSAVEQIRLYGVNLNSLPGTKLEVSAVVTMFGEEATPLVGPDATSPKLREAIESRPPRVLHLATHGLMGSASRPLLASLALTTPKVPTPEDTGFVTLEDIMSTWGARLKGTELVVLSACDTARGVQQGDTSMSLPLGLFVCGAETVIASQWKVDDTATALLMSRFYANWLGKTESERGVDGVKYAPGVALPKLAALREAKAWLRGLTREQVREILNAGSDQAGVEAITRITRGVDDDIDDRDTSQNPYAHPYYWSAFVLYGSPK